MAPRRKKAQGEKVWKNGTGRHGTDKRYEVKRHEGKMHP
jgi:hypothetical protein